ncbi:MAG: hypothetical protein ACE5HD_03870 [Acidobacteriota bacterium]
MLISGLLAGSMAQARPAPSGEAAPPARPETSRANRAGQNEPAAQPAEVPAAGKKTEADDTDKGPLRFTNEDLPALHPADRRGGSIPSAVKNEEAPARRSEKERTVQAGQRRSVADLQEEIDTLEARLARLKDRRRALQNPLLRGLTAADEEETRAVAGRSNVDRLAWVNEQIALSEAALQEARRRQAILRRR